MPAIHVHDSKKVRDKAESSNIPGCKVCAGALTDLGTGAAILVIKVSPGLLKSKREKSLTTSFTNACVTNVSDGRKNVRKKAQRNTANTGKNIRANAQLTSLEQVRRWNLLLQ